MQAVATWSGAEQRRHARVPVALRADILFFRRRTAVRLLDLSRGGAMAVTDEVPPARGDEVVLEIDGVQVVSTIAWIKDSSFGLSFHRALEKWQFPRGLKL